MNRKMRRQKRPGESYADQLARKKALRDAAERAAYDQTLEKKSEIQTQRALWMAMIAMNMAFGIGPKRATVFAGCLKQVAEWYGELTQVDEDYANEKLRRRASQCVGMELSSFYEDDMMAALDKHEGDPVWKED